MAARFPQRAIAFFLIIAWSLTCMHLALVAHGVSRSGKLLENTESLRAVTAPVSAASTWSVGDVNEQPTDHSCALAELISPSVLINGASVMAYHAGAHHSVEGHFQSAVVDREILERAPKASPPRA